MNNIWFYCFPNILSDPRERQGRFFVVFFGDPGGPLFQRKTAKKRPGRPPRRPPKKRPGVREKNGKKTVLSFFFGSLSMYIYYCLQYPLHQVWPCQCRYWLCSSTATTAVVAGCTGPRYSCKSGITAERTRVANKTCLCPNNWRIETAIAWLLSR